MPVGRVEHGTGDLGDGLGQPPGDVGPGNQALGLAGQADQLHLELADAGGFGPGKLDRLDDHVFGEFPAAALEHDHVAAADGHDQVELALVYRVHGRIDDQGAVDPADAHGRNRAVPGDVGEHERGRCPDEPQQVRVVLGIGADDHAMDLGLAGVAVREQRAQRAVDQTCGQDLALAGPALALEETAGDLARCVAALAVLDGQGEEPLPGRRPHVGDDRHEYLCIPVTDKNRPVGLLRHVPGFEDEPAPGQ